MIEWYLLVELIEFDEDEEDDIEDEVVDIVLKVLMIDDELEVEMQPIVDDEVEQLANHDVHE